MGHELGLFFLHYLRPCRVSCRVSFHSEWCSLINGYAVFSCEYERVIHAALLTHILSKLKFGEVACLQCLRPFSHTYSRNWSPTCLIHFGFWWNGVVYNVYIDFQRFTILRYFGAGFVYNVYVVFHTHIVEIEVWWSCLSTMSTSVFTHI